MIFLSYVKIKNFKVFEEEIKVDFEEMTILIGPNNAGKTSVIQALALWQLGIRAFFDTKTEIDPKTNVRKAKGKLSSSTGVGIDRRDIEQVPNTDTRQLFYKGRVRTGRDNEKIEITVGIRINGNIEECGVQFKYFKSEIIYCYLNEQLANNMPLLEVAARLQINLLYPMSGLEREETILQEGAIRKQIGRGVTAGLLRNICYYLYSNSSDDWDVLAKWMEKLFYIQLLPPKRLSNDDLILEYNYVKNIEKTEKPLDIIQAGRGQLQMLLILAFVMWRKNSLILIDEPDAHLEVLRQKQVIEILRTLQIKYNNQVVVATHSEEVMEQAEQLTFLLNGKKIDLDESHKKAIKSSLKDFGIEHYYKAELTKAILYLEGTTDKKNLTAIATLLEHPAADLLSDRIFVFYTQNPDHPDMEFDKKAGYYSTHYKHFRALSPIIQSLRGYALFDGDNKGSIGADSHDGLKTRYWKKYELENYFIYPESIMAWAQDKFIALHGGSLFVEAELKKLELALEKYFLLPIFDDKEVLLDLYKKSDISAQKALYQSSSATKKVSTLLEDVFRELARQNNDKMLLKKGDFDEIVKYCKKEEIDKEVLEKLDELYQSLSISEYL